MAAVKTIQLSCLLAAQVSAKKAVQWGWYLEADCGGKKQTAKEEDDPNQGVEVEGCYSSSGGSYKITIESGEYVKQHYDKPLCSPSDVIMGGKETRKLDKCIDGYMEGEEIEAEDHVQIETYDDKDEACTEDTIESGTILHDLNAWGDTCHPHCWEMKDNKDDRRLDSHSSDEQEDNRDIDVWVQYTFEGGNMKATFYKDKKCKKEDSDYPSFEVPGNGGCTRIESKTCYDLEPKVEYFKVWITQDGKSSSGQALQISHGVIALTSVASLMATLV